MNNEIQNLLDKENKISWVILVVIILAILLGFIYKNERVMLADGSKLWIQQYEMLESQKFPKTEYKLQTNDYPWDSIYNETADFELITKNLKIPIVFRGHEPNISIKQKENLDYEKTGKLEKAWERRNDEVLVSYTRTIPELTFSIDGRIWALKSDISPDKYTYLNTFDGSIIDDRERYKLLESRRWRVLKDNQGNFTKIDIRDAGKNHVLWGLINKENEILWSNKFRSKHKDYIYAHPEYLGSFKDSVLFFNKGSIHCIDYSSGFEKWVLKNDDVNELVYRYFNDEYLFLYVSTAVDHFYYDSSEYCKFYRLNLENLEMVEVELEPYWFKYFYINDEKICFRQRERGPLKTYGLDDGKLLGTVSPPESKRWGNYDNSNPLMIEHEYEDRFVETIFNPETSEETLVAERFYDEENDKFYTSNFIVYSEYGNMCIEDDEYFYGYNLDTHEKTWIIDKSELGEGFEVVIIDAGGVLVCNNERMVCYR